MQYSTRRFLLYCPVTKQEMTKQDVAKQEVAKQDVNKQEVAQQAGRADLPETELGDMQTGFTLTEQSHAKMPACHKFLHDQYMQLILAAFWSNNWTGNATS